jgi:flagellar export protein FliJ
MLGTRPFRYAVLLRVRKRQEDLKAQALGEVRRSITPAMADRDLLDREKRRALDQVATAARRRFDASDVQRYYQYERHLAWLAAEKDAQLRELRGEEDKRRMDLEDAMKQRRIVERLEERHDERVRAERRKADQQFSDQVAISQAALRQGARAS